MKLYIDPGTGSMLFTILIGIIGALAFFLRSSFVKLKFLLTGGKKTEVDSDKIPIVIFSDDKRYWMVFKPICEEFDKRGIRVRYMTASPDDPALKNEYEYIDAEFIGENNRAFSKLNFLNADIVFSTTPGLDVFQWKRSKKAKYYVHIPHTCSDISRYHMFGLDYYDAVLLSADYQVDTIRKLEALRGLPEKELKIVGVPYMDEMLKRLESADRINNDVTTVLLAPTWGKSGILNKFGEEFIDRLIETGYRIIIRPHPQSFTSEKEMIERLMNKYAENKNLEWNRDSDNFDVLNRADILISDVSGVMFDFSLVYDKPIIYTDTEYDKSPYDAWWLDEELWTFSILDKLGKELNADNMNNIKDIIDECISSNVYADGRELARNQTWANIGEGAKLTVDYIESKLNDLNRKGRD